MGKLKATKAGERLDRFELIAELASGGMATVFLARLGGVAGFQRFVAIKRLHPHLAQEPEFVDMFLDEARLAARIHHPNVVPILEIGTTAQGYYLVMEYIEGDTAARLLARSAQASKRFPASVAIRIALDTLAGLHAAHELSDDDGKPLEIIHRDVSPQNILVGINGTSKITDFGVARAASRLSTTRSGQLKGKLAYMAPEQARGTAMDRRADVFAMGAVVWEMLAGRRLFKGEGEAETLNRVLFEPIPRLRAVDPSVPAAIDEVIMRALQRDPVDRYDSALKMAEALEVSAGSLDLLASPRQVAAHLDTVMGVELSQQREAVRAWLARSEPSRNERVVLPEGPSGGPVLPPLDVDTEPETVLERPGARTDSDDASEPSTPYIRRSNPAVSSVSSAVIAVPKHPPPGTALDGAAQATLSPSQRPPPPHPKPRTSTWLVAAVGVMGLMGVAAVVLKMRAATSADDGLPAGRSASGSAVAPNATASPTTPMTAQASDPQGGFAAVPPPGVPAATDAGVFAATQGPASPSPAVTSRPKRPSNPKPPPAPPPSATTPPLPPDDISHNPYR